MPGPLIQGPDIAHGAITAQPRVFGVANKSSARSARVFFYFRTADTAVAMPHSLGKTPSSWRVVNLSKDGTPGVVYAPVQGVTSGTKTKTGHLFCLGRNAIVLASSVANSWAEIEIT